MPVTDHQVATLRSLLAGDFDEHRMLRAQLDKESDREGYSALIAAAFFEAADRRFATGHSRAEIVEFVASARAFSEEAAEKIDPPIAERLIRGVFEDEDMHDVAAETIMGTQLMLLAALVSGARFDATGLDMFMTDSRKLAERWTSSGDS